jgi:hypothetical protein
MVCDLTSAGRLFARGTIDAEPLVSGTGQFPQPRPCRQQPATGVIWNSFNQSAGREVAHQRGKEGRFLHRPGHVLRFGSRNCPTSDLFVCAAHFVDDTAAEYCQ